MPDQTDFLLDRSVKARTGEIAGLRSVVVDALPPATSLEAREDVVLLFMELVTNAIRHSGAGPDEDLHVRMYGRGDRLCVDVEDPGKGFESVGLQQKDEGGWGLQIVDRMAADWGIRPGPRPPTVVWFELILGP